MTFKELEGIPIERIPFCDLSAVNSDALVFILNDSKRAAYIYSLLTKTQPDYKVIHLDFFNSNIYDKSLCDYNVFIKRAAALTNIALSKKMIVVCTIPAFNYKVPLKSHFEESLSLNKSANCSLNSLRKTLIEFGYLNVGVVRNKGEFAIRGGIIDVFVPTYDFPVRVDFLGNDIDSIKQFDIDSQISNNELQDLLITKCSEIILNDTAKECFADKYDFYNDYIKESIENGNYFPGIEWYLSCFHEKTTTILDYLPSNTVCIFDFELEKYNTEFFKTANAKYAQSKDVMPLGDVFDDSIKLALDKFKVLKTIPYLQNELFKEHDQTYNIRNDEDLARWKHNYLKKTTVIISVKSNGSYNIVSEILKDCNLNKVELFNEAQENRINIIISDLDNGFIFKNIFIFTEKNLFGADLKCSVKRKSQDIFKDYSALSVNDFVIHEKHGLAVFEGLVNLDVLGISHDFLSLRYKNNDRLYVPVENISLITKYGENGSEELLDVLKSNHWAKRKNAVYKKLITIANNLLELAAKRKLNTCEPYEIPDNYTEFCKGFQHIETDDQLAAIEDIQKDLTNNIPMDRLVCGDVGFGKTEIALRAAFIVAASGKQVVLLAPTTILVSQHYKNFLKRFSDFDIKVCQLSRFVTSSELRSNIDAIQKGDIKIIIATHSILSEKIKFNNLGLVIIDEEQHFGVKQKEFLKEKYPNIHFMTLSATPIPRTLQLAISGVKDFSIIVTPPIDRLPVRTVICEFDKNVIKNAIDQEVKVGGQVFFVTPRVEFLDNIFNFVTQLVPELVVKKVHGKSKDIEEILQDFCDHKVNILVSTNIIDSGIDIPNANTIFVHRFDLFGLSQLYQLRGRVGRSKRQAYAYFLLDNKRILTENAKKRIEVLSNLNRLGAGFTLASHDLDIRGAGNLLGEEQSGYMKEVGVELYQAMLQETIMMIKSGYSIENLERKDPRVNIAVPALIPDHYISDTDLRLEIYRKIGNIKHIDEIFNIEYELSDRFGHIPTELHNLLILMKVKLNCLRLNIENVDVGHSGFSFSFFNNHCDNPASVISFLNSDAVKGKYAVKMRPDNKVVILRKWKTESERTRDIDQFFSLMANAV